MRRWREWQGAQRPRLDPRIAEWLERREIERRGLVEMMEEDTTLIGRHLHGRVGTSMRGQGGVLDWAQPLYAAQRRREAARLAERQKQAA